MAVTFDFTPNGTQGAAVAGTGITKTGNTSTLVYDNVYPVNPPSASHLTVTGYGGIQAGFTAQAATGMSVSFLVPAYPAAGIWTYLAAWGNGSTRVGDIAMDSTGKVRIRDLNTAKDTSTGTVLTPGQFARVHIKCTIGSATGHQAQYFVGANVNGTTPDYDTGAKSATGQTTVTTINYFMAGQVTGTSQVDYYFGRMRVTNDASDPGSGYTGVPAAPTLNLATVAGAINLSWSAVSGQNGATVYRSTAASGPFAALASQPSATGTSFSDTTVTDGVVYYYTLRLSNATGWSPVSAVKSGASGSASSQIVYPISDDFIGGCLGINPLDATLASCLNEPVAPDTSNWVEIIPGGHYTCKLGSLSLPFGAGVVVQINYTLADTNNDGVTMALLQGTTVVATDVERTDPGSYNLTLTTAQQALITNGSDLHLQFTATI